jgi:hypothetical protein
MHPADFYADRDIELRAVRTLTPTTAPRTTT